MFEVGVFLGVGGSSWDILIFCRYMVTLVSDHDGLAASPHPTPPSPAGVFSRDGRPGGPLAEPSFPDDAERSMVVTPRRAVDIFRRQRRGGGEGAAEGDQAEERGLGRQVLCFFYVGVLYGWGGVTVASVIYKSQYLPIY